MKLSIHDLKMLIRQEILKEAPERVTKNVGGKTKMSTLYGPSARKEMTSSPAPTASPPPASNSSYYEEERTAQAIDDVFNEYEIATTDHYENAAGRPGNPDSLWGVKPQAWTDWVADYIDYVDSYRDEPTGYTHEILIPKIAEKMCRPNGFKSKIPGVTELMTEYWTHLANGLHPVDEISETIFEKLAQFVSPDGPPEGPMDAYQIADQVGTKFEY